MAFPPYYTSATGFYASIIRVFLVYYGMNFCTKINTKICEKFSKKVLRIFDSYYILIIAVTLIAKKREVAAEKQVFRGANVKLGN